MRLTCPNCEAQYEVNESVIPDDGRDVQCSNCGTTWFQESAAHLLNAALPEDADVDIADIDTVTENLLTAEEAPQGAPADAPPAPEKSTDAPGERHDEGVVAAAQTRPDLRRRNLDDAMLNVLREEAEREARARKAEGSSLETQAEVEFAATPPAPPPVETAASRRQDAPETGPESDDEGPDETLVSRSARRELLPDIEEINSTLRATSERGYEAAARDAPESLRYRRSGFRRGFLAALVVMSLLLLPYIFVGPLAARFPTLEPALMRYTTGIDALRIWLDDRIKSSTESMRGNSAETN